MIEQHTFGDITMLITPLPVREGKSRRAAEQEAVADLISTAFGEDAILCHHESGAPYILGSDCCISISHCRSHATLAWSSSRHVGIDIEEWRPQLPRVAHRVLSHDELAAYSTDKLLLQAWTLKEALYKAALTPGLDFRNDIALPMPPGTTTAHVLRHPFSVIITLTTPLYTLTLTASKE